jgi:hypothetical protein
MSIFSTPKVPKPTDIWKVNKKTGLNLPGQQLQGLTGYYEEALPAFLGLESQFTPEFMRQQFGFGAQGVSGFESLQRQAAGGAGQTIADLRAQELGQMTGQSGLARGLMQAMSPEQAAVVQGFASEAERARAAAQSVSPQERRGYEQQAREGFQASGRLGGNLGIVSEAMGREDVMARKRAEAAQAGARSYDAAQGFYTQPGLAALQSTPQSYTAGTALAGMGLELGQSMGPEFDYNMPLNFAQQRASALDSQKMAQFQASQQHRSQMGGLLMKGIGLAAAPFTGGLSAGLGLSGLAGGAGAATGLGGMGLSAGMGLSGLFGGIPKATPVY